MAPFDLDRAKAERSIADPEGALWPVNAYADADELDSLLQAALDSGAIRCAERRARLYVYPLSLAEPDPLLAVDPGPGPTLLGHSLKLIDREGEDPVAFTLRLLDDLAAEANGLVADAAVGGPLDAPDAEGGMTLLCPRCCSEEAASADRGTQLKCGNCGAHFHREQALVELAEVEAHSSLGGAESRHRSDQNASDPRAGWFAEVRVDRPEQLDELVRLAANAEIGLTVYEEAPCTCSPSRGCPQCFARADAMVGKTVRDDDGREWKVTDVDEKDGFPTLCDEDRWAYLADVEVIA